MGAVTLYTLANIQTALGGVNPISMSEYYRGGSYVPTTRASTTTLREPASGQYYTLVDNGPNNMVWTQIETGPTGVGWNSVNVYADGGGGGQGLPALGTSYTTGGYTYYRGTLMRVEPPSQYFPGSSIYGIYRTSIVASSVQINTGVPASGTISISQLYGAENP